MLIPLAVERVHAQILGDLDIDIFERPLFICLFERGRERERERKSERWGEGQKERERESQADPPLSTEPNARAPSQDPETMT